MVEKKIGVYLRLSDEDDASEESASLRGQRQLIYHYILSHRELSSYEILEFSDDGYSGTNFDRPGIRELLRKARDGEIFCIIVKDFSRFGRNYIEVGNYIEQVFPFLGVGFVSVNDNFDSNKVSQHGEMMGVAFQNLIYDLYSKDLSKKISSVRRAKAEQGKFITAFAPYGFQKSKEQKLVIDQKTAPVVQSIFKMALEGISQTQIARYLNSQEIPSPLMLRKMEKERFFCASISEKCLWSPATIGRILRDQRYVGDSVYGKVKPKKIGGRQSESVPKKEWIILPNTHEAIISREIYERIYSAKRTYEKRNKECHYPLWKKVRCGGCNYIMSRKVSGRKKDERGKVLYACPKLVTASTSHCYDKRMEEKQIEETVLFSLNKLLNVIFDGKYFNGQREIQIEKNQKIIIQQQEKLKKIGIAKVELYEAYKENKLGKNDFLLKKNEYQDLYEKTEKTLLLEKEKLSCSQRNFPKNREDMLRFYQTFPYPNLTRRLADIYINAIFIEQNGEIKIIWNFQDVFAQ